MPHTVYVPLPSPDDFDPAQTLDCGQAFRFVPHEQGEPDGVWEGVAGARFCRVWREGSAIAVECFCEGGCEAAWADYFDAARDYSLLKRRLSGDPVLRRAVGFAPGMRVLRQDGWEALCSFILSQNNNISRIKGIIRALCERYGPEIPGAGARAHAHAFPDARTLAGLSAEDLAPMRMGFRAGYVLDAAQRVASGEVDLRALREQELGEARAALQTIRGVGPKVADCALLYGLGRVECYPRDVWIKRADGLFPDGFPNEFADVAGLAQQYLFHYCRTCPGALDPVTI